MGATRTTLLALTGAVALACNQPPTTPTVTITPEAPITTDNLIVTYGDATDPNANDTVSYRVVWFQDGEQRQDLAGRDSVRFDETTKGEVWRASVSASDGNDVGPAAQVEVTIANAAPTATVELSHSNPFTDDTIRSTIAKRDADLDPVTVTYEWVVNGSVHSNSRQDLPASETVKGQVWELRVIPNDGEVDGEPAVAEFTVANTPPEVTSARISPLYPTRYDEIVCEGVGWFDLDGDDPAYDVQWLVNGAEYASTATLPAADLSRGDDVRCVLTPNDGDDPGEAVQSTPVEVQNTPPRLSDVEISPDDPLKDDTVVPTISGAEDLDGDEVSFIYEWKVNGAIAGDTGVLPSSRFSKGDIIRLDVYPTDGIDAGEAVTSNTVIGGNNLPEIIGITLSPEDVYTDSDLVAEVFSTDPDGDRVDLQVAWYVDGSKATETTTTLSGSSSFEKDQEIYVVVTPDDGEGSGAAVTSDTVTVLNSVPTAPVLVFDPAEPADGEDIQCVVDTDSTDADSEDTLTYTFRWLINGAGTTDVTTTDETGDTYVGGWTVEDDVVCVVTASDGTISSPEGSYGLAYGSEFNPGASCKDILAERSWYDSGTYWIDPDEDGDPSDAFEVYCDMESDGGGWTLAYYSDAEYFDGYYVNSVSRSKTAPAEINDQKDIWQVPSDLTHTETLVGCTTQNDAATHWWKWSSKYPYADWEAGSYSYSYRYRASSTRSSGSPVASCYSDYSGSPSYYYGFAAIETSSCGCRNIIWGMNHYSGSTSSTGCNTTDTSKGSHSSKWRTKSLQYPVCNKSQTTNGKFWIGVR